VRAFILNRKKNFFLSRRLLVGPFPWGNPHEILVFRQYTFFFTDKPLYPSVPLMALCTSSCASVACYNDPAPKKSSTKVNIIHMHSACTYLFSASPTRLHTIGVIPTPNPHVNMIMMMLQVRWNPIR
jgi:hypothetical protein